MQLGKALKRRLRIAQTMGCYALRQVQITGSPGRTRIGATRRWGKCLNDIFSGGFDAATGAAHHCLAAPFGYAADLGHD
jgi:hypothetical protein